QLDLVEGRTVAAQGVFVLASAVEVSHGRSREPAAGGTGQILDAVASGQPAHSVGRGRAADADQRTDLARLHGTAPESSTSTSRPVRRNTSTSAPKSRTALW